MRNSKHVANELWDITVDEDEILNSHYVLSLFTHTPVNKAERLQRLQKDTAWKRTTELEIDDIIELLEFLLTATYLIFRGHIYCQRFGTAMRSPVFPMVVDIHMELLEQMTIVTVPLEYKPRLWKRYVDDILEVINKETVEALTEHLNQVDTTGSIKFTHETEVDKMIPLLDTLIVRKGDLRVKLLVYRKKTHTEQEPDFSSHHPLQHKLNVVRTLLDRCSQIVTG